MKEFDKKGNPSRDPSSEGMKGLSKFLPMTDSNYRRRLTEYEVQVQDLQATSGRSRPRPGGSARSSRTLRRSS